MSGVSSAGKGADRLRGDRQPIFQGEVSVIISSKLFSIPIIRYAVFIQFLLLNISDYGNFFNQTEENNSGGAVHLILFSQSSEHNYQY